MIIGVYLGGGWFCRKLREFEPSRSSSTSQGDHRSLSTSAMVSSNHNLDLVDAIKLYKR